MVIIDCNKKNDGNINDKETNERLITTIQTELRQQHSRRGHV